MQPPRAGQRIAETVKGQHRTLGVSDDLEHVIDCRGAVGESDLRALAVRLTAQRMGR